ncbi:MAG: PsbP-related protein [Patescibacteria group bacterium]|nr:PsbP-related protein [Patescibacteria group bacterium]
MKGSERAGVIFIVVLALAMALGLYFFQKSRLEPAMETLPAPLSVEAPVSEPSEELEPIEFVSYKNQSISFKHPSKWFEGQEEDFLVFTSWDPNTTPERGERGLRLVVGKVTTDLGLDEYVSEYLNQNISSDPSYALIARHPAALGGLPSVIIQASTDLEGGSVIQSAFVLRNGELWSVDLISRVLNEDSQDIFDNVLYNFSFINNN